MTLDDDLKAMQSILARVNAPRQGAGRSRKRPITPADESQPARVAKEPQMALAFFLRRMDGMGWDRAAAETAKEFGLTGNRAGPSAIERAARDWKRIAVPFLIGQFPDKADRLREFLRERSA